MPLQMPVRCEQLPKDTMRIILQLLLDDMGFEIIQEREWVGAAAKYVLKRKGEPLPIVKAKAVDEISIPVESHAKAQNPESAQGYQTKANPGRSVRKKD